MGSIRFEFMTSSSDTIESAKSKLDIFILGDVNRRVVLWAYILFTPSIYPIGSTFT